MDPQKHCASGAKVKDVAEKIADLCNEPQNKWASRGGLSAGGDLTASPIDEQIFGKPCGSLLAGKDVSGNWIANVPAASTVDACEVYGALNNSANAEPNSKPMGTPVVSGQHKRATGEPSHGSETVIGNGRALNLNGAVIPGRGIKR